MSVKNLVYNKLAKQNMFFALLIQFRFQLFWLTAIIIYTLILLIIIIITIAFIILILFLCFIVIIVIIIIVLSIISVFFILFFFLIVHITMTFVCALCVMCICPLVIFFPFLVNDLHFILALLIHVKNHFLFSLPLISSLSSSQSFYFFQHYQLLG